MSGRRFGSRRPPLPRADVPDRLLDGVVDFFDADPDRFVLVRYNTNGTLDQSFGDGGFVFTSFGNTETGANAAARTVCPGRSIASGE